MRGQIKNSLMLVVASAGMVVGGSGWTSQPATASEPGERTKTTETTEPKRGTVDERAREVLDAFIEALGGKDAMRRSGNVHQKIRFMMKAQGISSEGDVWIHEKHGMRTKIDLASSEQGLTADGKAWSYDEINGPRVLEGSEASALRRGADPLSWARPEQYFKSITYGGEETLEGKTMHKLDLVPWEGEPSSAYFNAEDGMMYQWAGKIDTPYGLVPTTTTIASYKDYDGLKWPTMVVQEAMGQRIEVETLLVEYGKVTAEDVTPPQAIKTLLAP